MEPIIILDDDSEVPFSEASTRDLSLIVNDIKGAYESGVDDLPSYGSIFRSIAKAYLNER